MDLISSMIRQALAGKFCISDKVECEGELTVGIPSAYVRWREVKQSEVVSDGFSWWFVNVIDSGGVVLCVWMC